MSDEKYSKQDWDMLRQIISLEVGPMRDQLEKIHEDLRDGRYVTKAEFLPVRNIVFTGAGLILIAFIGSIITLVFKQ